MNPRLTNKERNLLKGAVRRVFSRSELRNEVIKQSVIEHSDPDRKRVKTWVLCAECKRPEAKSNVAVDHILPVVPLDSDFNHMSFDHLIDNLWCDIRNLQVLCETCHDSKTQYENKLRRAFKKGNVEYDPVTNLWNIVNRRSK
jgi:5-methylcytosine-specific restriction endonuclease McrA